MESCRPSRTPCMRSPHALSFLPSWARGGDRAGARGRRQPGGPRVLARLTRRAFCRPARLISLIPARTRALTRLAFVTIALALVLPAIDLPPRAAALFATALPFCFVVLLGWIALIAVDIGVNMYLMRFRLDADDNLLARKHVTQMRVLRRVISTVVIADHRRRRADDDRRGAPGRVSLFASAGVAGLAAGLAARPVLANLIAGIQLAMTQPIRIEDAVIVENEWGWIEEITSTFVVVRLWDLRRLIVPLSYFMEKPFQNWTREGSAIIGAVLLYLDYTAPIEAIRAKAEAIVAASRLWDRKVVNTQVTDTKERVIEVRVLVSAANASAAFDLRCEVREQLIAFLRSEHPEVAAALAQRDGRAAGRRPPRDANRSRRARAGARRPRARRTLSARLTRPSSHSALTPVASITVFHSCACSPSAAAKSCAVPIFASMPSLARLVRTSADCEAVVDRRIERRRRLRAACRRAPASQTRLRSEIRRPRPPAWSACSGSSGQRALLVTASGRSLPLLKWTSSVDLLLNTMSMCPPSRSVIAGAAPL